MTCLIYNLNNVLEFQMCLDTINLSISIEKEHNIFFAQTQKCNMNIFLHPYLFSTTTISSRGHGDFEKVYFIFKRNFLSCYKAQVISYR